MRTRPCLRGVAPLRPPDNIVALRIISEISFAEYFGVTVDEILGFSVRPKQNLPPPRYRVTKANFDALPQIAVRGKATLDCPR